ncbi:MAG TPA: hypothetical protein VLW49_01695 [Gaiellaceae bacterium]|nr:hypothetical protein [Gaiellaceae bacterium]
MQTPESAPSLPPEPRARRRPPRRTPAVADWSERLAWLSGLVLAVSAFTDWYSGTLPNGLTLSVTGWHTGGLGKLVFFIGLLTLILEALREARIGLPPEVPERLVLVALGALATIFVLIRSLSVPDAYFANGSRGVGLYIALLAALALLGTGLLRTAEEL